MTTSVVCVSLFRHRPPRGRVPVASWMWPTLLGLGNHERSQRPRKLTCYSLDEVPSQTQGKP